MPIVWTIDLDTGIAVIDIQHKRIVDYINQLESARQQHDRAVVGRVLTELIEYTLSHFAFEESLQLEADFKYVKVHKTLHELFTNNVVSYQARHNAGEDVAEELHSMLSTWLLNHIKREDKAFASSVGAEMNRVVADEKEGSWLSQSLKKFFK
jgi:hemerythrin